MIDNHAPVGDAVGPLPDRQHRFGALSTITGCYILHALEGEVADLMIAEGEEPPVLLSSNLEGDASDNHKACIFSNYADSGGYL